MKLLLCSVFDSKVGAYAAPFCARTKGEAIRSFEQACRDASLPFQKYPADYRLFLIGEYDDNIGSVRCPHTPEPLIGADEIGGLQVDLEAAIKASAA